jgi:hypothetical protein
LVSDEVGHGPGGLEPRPPRAWAARRRRLADQAAGAQIGQGIDVVDGNQARDATAAHRHDHFTAVPDVLDIAAEPVVQLRTPTSDFSGSRCGVLSADCTGYIGAITDSPSRPLAHLATAVSAAPGSA